MAINKVLVIGSTKHQHATCIDWLSIDTVNIVDFDTVVVNTRSLSPEIIQEIDTQGSSIRTSLARLLASQGSIVVLGDKLTQVKTNKNGTVDNYFWSPVVLSIVSETGDTITLKINKFPNYLSKLKKWNFYYKIPDNFLTPELIKICGNHLCYTDLDVLATNRYESILAGTLAFTIEDTKHQRIYTTGHITLMPSLEDVDDRQSVSLALEDLLGLPQETLPPEWAETIKMPLVGEIRSEVEERETTIASLEREISDRLEKIRSLEIYKKLLYAGGHELEALFADCLEQCGGVIKPAHYSDEEFILEYKEETYLIECKGVGKSIARSHVVQLLGYLTKFEEDEGRAGKGILLGNAWKDLPLSKRNQADTPMFPDNVTQMATSNSITLVSSVDFFHVFCRFLGKEIPGKAILDQITDAVGVVDFNKLLISEE